ncbi:MAG: hypothetical protein AAF556_06225, partial [Pseudomonadota bacterium]
MPDFNNRRLNAHVGEVQRMVSLTLLEDSAERDRMERALGAAVDQRIGDAIRQSMAGEGHPAEVFEIGATATAPAFAINAVRQDLVARIEAAKQQFDGVAATDTGIPLDRAARPVELWRRTRKGAEAFKNDVARLYEPLSKLSKQLVEDGHDPVNAETLKSNYGGLINPVRMATDPVYRQVRGAIVEVHRNIAKAKRREPPFADIRFGVHPDRPNAVPRLSEKYWVNMEGLAAADRLIEKADRKLAAFEAPLRLAELRTLSQSMDQVDEQVVAEGVARYRDPLALEVLASKTKDPALAEAVLDQVKATALDNLSRSMFDHSVNAGDTDYRENGLGKQRGQVRPFRDMTERNRTMIGYQIHDYGLVLN